MHDLDPRVMDELARYADRQLQHKVRAMLLAVVFSAGILAGFAAGFLAGRWTAPDASSLRARADAALKHADAVEAECAGLASRQNKD